MHSQPNYNINNSSDFVKNYINYRKDNNSDRNSSKMSHRIGSSSEMSFASSNMIINKFKEKN